MDVEILTKELLSLNKRLESLKEKNIRYQEQLRTTNLQIVESESKIVDLGVDPQNIDTFILELEQKILTEKSDFEKSIKSLEIEYQNIDDKLRDVRSY